MEKTKSKKNASKKHLKKKMNLTKTMLEKIVKTGGFYKKDAEKKLKELK